MDNMIRCFTILGASMLLLTSGTVHAVTIDWVTVGNPANAADTEVMITDSTTGYGSVSYTYRIGKYEVTNDQYAELLNAVAVTNGDALGLYSTFMNSAAWGGITRTGSGTGERSLRILGQARAGEQSGRVCQLV